MLEEGRRPFGRKPVVAVSPNGDIAAYFESLTDAANFCKLPPGNIWRTIHDGLFCKKHRWMYEQDYRTYWMEGRTKELAYNRKQILREHIMESVRRRSPESEARRREKLSQYRKKLYSENPDYPFRQHSKARRRRIRCSTTGEEFESIKAFCLKYSVSPGNAWCCLNGRKKSVAGMKIEYINN